jgi:hypothetical protein
MGTSQIKRSANKYTMMFSIKIHDKLRNQSPLENYYLMIPSISRKLPELVITMVLGMIYKLRNNNYL